MNHRLRLGLSIAALSALLGVLPTSAVAEESATIEAGRRIYAEGRLPDGAPLRATRSGHLLEGAAAACVQCHRPSGLGQVEGEYAVPPITGRALFGARRNVVVNADPVRGKAMNLSHEPYAEAEVERMLRDGHHPSGRMLGEVMPRYALDAPALSALLAYLRTLSARWSPGVERDVVRLATVITPGVDPERRRAFLGTLQAAVKRKNANTMPGRRHMVSAAEFVMKTERRWDLQVWELEGDASTWGAQLAARHARAPVFAILSGLSDGDWTPVARFCDAERVPCWFPSVAQPGGADAQGAWSLHFHRGVLLEADLLAHDIARTGAPRGVLQVTDASPASVTAARALHARLAAHGIASRVSDAPGAAQPGEIAVLWGSPAALARWSQSGAPPEAMYVSGVLAGGDASALGERWARHARVAYPYELPALRGQSTAYFRYWLGQTGVPLSHEVLQGEAYFAVAFLADTLADMLENLHRDYLLERAELMLSRRESRKAEDERRDAQGLRRYATTHPLASAVAGAPLEREGTSIYPSLALGPGQRFASKGGYVVPATQLSAAMRPSPGAIAWITP